MRCFGFKAFAGATGSVDNYFAATGKQAAPSELQAATAAVRLANGPT